MGVVNDCLIVWGIVKVLVDQGVELVFFYQGDVFGKWVELLVVMVGLDFLLDVDVNNDVLLDVVFGQIVECWGKLDFVVYVIVFFDKNELIGCFVDILCENFKNLLMIFCYLLIDVVCCVVLLMIEGGMIIMLIYVGLNWVMLFYNVMGVVKVVLELVVCYLVNDFGLQGICVNVISFGLMKMLVGVVIGGVCKIYCYIEVNVFLCVNVMLDVIGGIVVWLCLDWGVCIMGEIVLVDGGYYVLGML